MTRIKNSKKKETKSKPFTNTNDNPMGPLSDDNPNQNHNSKKEALGPNTKR